LNLWPNLVSLDKIKDIITKDEKYWSQRPNSRSNMKGGAKSQYFSFKDFIKALELMAIPERAKLTRKDISEAKAKFFSKLQKLIER